MPARPILHPRNVVLGVRYAQRRGLRAALARATLRLGSVQGYDAWVARYDTLRARDRDAIRAHMARLRDKPAITVVMRLDAARSGEETIASVVAQLYPNWTLRLVGPAALPADSGGGDPRILTDETVPDLGGADFVALVEPGDVLPPHALYTVAAELNEHPDADILYSDEDAIDAAGRRRDPVFKPDWGSALFLHSAGLVRHLAVFRAALLREAGGWGGAFGPAGDYDLALRVASRTSPERIRHIPRILYHARERGPIPAEAAMRALRAHLAARGEPAEVVAAGPARWRVKHALPQPAPRVSLIVPTRDRVELLRACIDGLLHRTRYPALDIVIVDNDSCEPQTLAYFDALREERRVRVLRVEGAFNFSQVNNRAAAVAEGELIGFVNNDIDVIHPDWLEEMVRQAVRPAVGAVGAKLYYSDDTIQHAGVVLGLGGVAGHVHRHAPRDAEGYCGRLRLVQDTSCITAACMLVWKRVFDAVGGFDAVGLKIAFNDVDLCIRIREAGYRLVWTPYAELYHRESASRGSDLSPGQVKRFEREKAIVQRRWDHLLERDPFYNPNLSLDDENCGLAFPPRARKPWRRR